MKKLLGALLISQLALGQIGTVLAVEPQGFSDVPKGGEYYDAIGYLKTEGIIEGYADGTFKPFNTINRAEFTKILVGSMKKGQATGSNCFPDVKSEWFAPYVCTAKNLELIGGYPDGSFKPAQNINFVEAAKIIVNAEGGEPAGAGYSQWYEKYVHILDNAKAIPTTINTFDQTLTRGEMAEIIYRLKTNTTTKPSMGFDEIAAAKGYLEGSLSFPSEGIPSNMFICADNIEMAITFCTAKQIKSSKYQYGVGYKLPVRGGTYNVYAFVDGNPEYRGIYSEYVTCGLNASCKSHASINVDINPGQTLTKIDPTDWYANN